MSTWLQELILAVQNTNDVAPSLSSYLSESLKTMQQYDRISNKIKMEIKSYEKKLIDKLESECKSKTSEELQNLDETEYKNGLQILNSKRQKLSQIYDYQLKIANSCYELIDKKISAFDSAVQPISLQYPNILPSLNDTNEEETKIVKGKKRKTSAEEQIDTNIAVVDDFDVILNSLSLDPNEPKYCLCKRVSYGEMVACENLDCQTEWFHFRCVGLKQAPPDPWYCPQCIALGVN